LLDVAADSGARLGFVGGAGSLFVSEGGPRLFDTPEFPDAFLYEAQSQLRALDTLRASDSPADWFYVSPAAGFGSYAPGERTGHYRTGGEILLADENGTSFISGEDYAIAFLDEIENPSHSRSRFGVAY
jgi:putative NADH-flavin reductase